MPEMVYLKNKEINKVLVFLKTGQATFSLFHINEIRLGVKIITQKSLNRALIFCTAVNSNCYYLIFLHFTQFVSAAH